MISLNYDTLKYQMNMSQFYQQKLDDK